MSLKLPADTRRARIAHQLVGQMQRLHLRHVPSDFVLIVDGKDHDLATSMAALRSMARMAGYVVDNDDTVADWRATTEKMKAFR